MREKIIRDPVHDVIAFDIDEPIDGLLFRLLNAEEFQRLRRIRQLGMASLAYPGADHARYSHSLGVMETARKMLAQLRRSVAIDEEAQTVCLCAALLHDLGHGPFSHVFERVSGMDHELLTQQVLSDPEAGAHRIMAGHERTLPMKVAAFLRGEPRRTVLNDVISSQLDADRFDYLLRDNLMSGSQYGAFDLQWLLHALMVDAESNRLVIGLKGISAAEAYLQSRYHMYRNVYFHKVVRSAEGMVKLALQRARRLAVQDRLAWPPRDNCVFKALLGQRLTIAEFTDLDDISVLHCFKLWMRVDDPVLVGLCRGLLYRGLFKTIDLGHRAGWDGDAQRALSVAQTAIAQAGGEAAYDIFLDEPHDTPYQAGGARPENGGEIMVRDEAGRLTELSQLSALPAALDRQLVFHRLHVAEAYWEVVNGAMG